MFDVGDGCARIVIGYVDGFAAIWNVDGSRVVELKGYVF